MARTTKASLELQIQTLGLGKLDSLQKALKRVAGSELRAFNNETARSMLGLGNAAEKAAQKTGGLFDGFGGFLKTAARATVVTAGLVRGFRMIEGAVGAALKPMLNFESTMANVRIKGDFTAGQTRDLADMAKQIGRTTRYTPQQAAETQVDLAAAGIGAEGVKSALPTVLKFAQAGDLSGASASKILSNTMSQFGLDKSKPKEWERIGNMLVKSANMSTIDVQQIAHTLTYVGPLAKTAKMPFDQLMAMTALLGNAGITGSKAGTGLRNMIGSTARPPRRAKAANKLLSMIGMSQKDLSEGLLDIPALMKQIGDRMAKLAPNKRIAIESTLFGQYGMTTADALIDVATRMGTDGKSMIEQYATAIAQATTALQDAADIAGGTTQGKLDMLNAKWETLKITLGEKFAPALGNAVDKLSEFVVKWEAWANTNPQALKDITDLVYAMSEALPTAFTVAGKAAQGLALAITPLANMATIIAQVYGVGNGPSGQKDVSAADEAAARENFIRARVEQARSSGQDPYQARAQAGLAYDQMNASVDEKRQANEIAALEQARAQHAASKGAADAAGLSVSSSAGNMSEAPAPGQLNVNIQLSDDLKARISRVERGAGPDLSVGYSGSF